MVTMTSSIMGPKLSDDTSDRNLIVVVVARAVNANWKSWYTATGGLCPGGWKGALIRLAADTRPELEIEMPPP